MAFESLRRSVDEKVPVMVAQKGLRMDVKCLGCRNPRQPPQADVWRMTMQRWRLDRAVCCLSLSREEQRSGALGPAVYLRFAVNRAEHRIGM